MLLTSVASRTTSTRRVHPGGVPERTLSPRHALDLVRRDGAAIIDAIDTGSSDAVLEAALAFMGDELAAIQTPKIVGSEVGNALAAVEAAMLVPHHCDSIDGFRSHVGPDGRSYVEDAPDYILLCGRRSASDGGGTTFLADIPSAMRRMSEAKRRRLRDMDFLHYNTTERLVISNPRRPAHPCHRMSQGIMDSFSSRATTTLLTVDRVPTWTHDANRTTIRAAPASSSSTEDMESIASYLGAVAAESDEAARFTILPRTCVAMDNYRTTHGREPFTDLTRSLWQVWIWSNATLGIPENAGSGRTWFKHSRVDAACASSS